MNNVVVFKKIIRANFDGSSRMKLVIVRRLACQNVRMLVPLEETIEICTRKDRVQPRKDSTV